MSNGVVTRCGIPFWAGFVLCAVLATGCHRGGGGATDSGGSTAAQGGSKDGGSNNNPNASNGQQEKQANRNGGGDKGKAQFTEPVQSVTEQPSTASDDGGPSAVAHRSIAEPGAPEGTLAGKRGRGATGNGTAASQPR